MHLEGKCDMIILSQKAIFNIQQRTDVPEGKNDMIIASRKARGKARPEFTWMDEIKHYWSVMYVNDKLP